MTPEELAEARKELGLNAREFAELIDVDQRTIRAWENGDSNSRPIPHIVGLLVRLALKFPAVRRELLRGAVVAERQKRLREWKKLNPADSAQ